MKKLVRLTFILAGAWILSACTESSVLDSGDDQSPLICEAPFVPDEGSCEFPPLRLSTQVPTLIGAGFTPDSAHHSYDFDVDRAVMYEVNIRQYSEEGTFKAVQDDLPRLADLGVDILWLMPIHPISETLRKGELGSYYAIQDYRAVNPEFGTMDDFDALLGAAHDLGFKVILDLVINHTGWDHPWVTTHPDYYTQVNGRIIHPAGTDWTDVADLNHSHPDLVEDLAAMTAFWVEKGVDGYRADVAGSVPNHVWEAVDSAIKAVNPDAFLLAEDNSVFNWFEIFNSHYGGWWLLHEMHQIAHGATDESGLIHYLTVTHDRYLDGTFPLLFTTNHDVNSWEGTHEERLGPYTPLMQTLTFTLPGMPLVYSGQEADIEKPLAFFEKDIIPWGQYAGTDFLKSLITMRDDNPALFSTNVFQSTFVLEDDDVQVLSFLRTTPDHSNQVLVVANLSGHAKSVALHLHDFRGHWTEDDTVHVLSQKPTLDLKPYGIRILTRNQP